MALALTALTFTFSAAACGSDDDGDSAATTAGGATATTAAAAATTTDAAETTDAPETTEATETTEQSDTTAGGSGGAQDVDAFCQAEIEAEAAAAQDPAAAGPAFEALIAAAPEEIASAVEGAVANAESGPGTPEFDEPYAEMISYMKDNCGFNEIDVEGADYSFTGIPADVEAGPTIFTFDNVGEEVHEMVLFRVDDDATESATELLELGEEEFGSKVTFAGVAFGFPGSTSYTATDLETGRYIANCFLPEGSTPEAFEQMMAQEQGGPDVTAPEGSMEPMDTTESMPEGSAPSGGEQGGPPHFMLGMVQEFTVT